MRTLRLLASTPALRGLAAAALVSLAPAALAAAPRLLAVHGVLKNGAGAAVSGVVSVTFSVYDVPTGGAALHQETAMVTATNGFFSANLGSPPAGQTSPTFDLSIVTARTDLWLGVKLSTEPAEMAPRSRLGSAPYAAFATEAAMAQNGVPAGAVMFFDLPQCPSGWTAYGAAQGRAVVGVPAGGTLATMVGNAYGNAEDRGHVHEANPPLAQTTEAPAHPHTVDPMPTAVDGATVSVGAHRHVWVKYDAGAHSFAAWRQDGTPQTIIAWGDGYDNEGKGIYAIGFNSNQAWTPLATETAGAHSMSHSHKFDPPATSSAPGGAHRHDVDVAASPTQAMSAGVPYVQLLACRKQ
jgi:hypothetical protein